MNWFLWMLTGVVVTTVSLVIVLYIALMYLDKEVVTGKCDLFWMWRK